MSSSGHNATKLHDPSLHQFPWMHRPHRRYHVTRAWKFVPTSRLPRWRGKCTGCSSSRRQRFIRSKRAGSRRKARPYSRSTAATPAAAGRNGRRVSTFGSPILQFDATGEREFLEIGRARTVELMAIARQPHRRPRPRLPQPRHLRQPAAPDERGPHRGGCLGAPFLRAGAQGLRRRSGGALVAHGRGRRVHLFLQRPTLAVRRHHPLACAVWQWRTGWATR